LICTGGSKPRSMRSMRGATDADEDDCGGALRAAPDPHAATSATQMPRACFMRPAYASDQELIMRVVSGRMSSQPVALRRTGSDHGARGNATFHEPGQWRAATGFVPHHSAMFPSS